MKKLLLLFTFAVFAFSGCSRESDIRVNGTLRNNHSVVFAFTERPDSLEAFIDSIAALDSVYTYDTLTVTVHDTLFFVGFLKYNTDKVLRYAWKMQNEDSLRKAANGEIFAFAYDSVALYSPLFIAVDGASARDTAGRGQFIRVIDTPPEVSISQDTLWTRGKRDAEVSFFATDSFGKIKKAFLIPMDGKGKSIDTVDAAKDSTLESSYRAKVKFSKVESHLDKNNELKFIFGAVDDDGNVSQDTAVLHFNKIPTIQLLEPDSSSRKNIYVSRFAFYYSGEDEDNPVDLRYTIRVGKSPDNSGTPPILTDANLVASGIREKSWEAITDSVWKMSEDLRGRLFWQVSVTDGYDTVTSPTWNFFLGDLNATTGAFHGYAKFQGRKAHNGIQIVLENLQSHNYIFTHTSEKGYFHADVDPGTYRIYARDTTGFGYKHLILDSQFVEMGDERLVATMLLEDSIAPKIRIDKFDSILTERAATFYGTLSDSGSQVAQAKAWLDDGELPLSVLKVNEWHMNFSDLEDGEHRFRLVVLDSAGNVSDTAKMNFKVKASSLELTVNGQSTAMITSTESLKFVAKVGNVKPLPDSVHWKSVIEGKTYAIEASVVGSDSSAQMTLTADELEKNGAVPGVLYTLYASVSNGTVTDSVRFGIRGDKPNIYFLTPTSDTAVSINDKIDFSLQHFLGAEATSGTITWTCPAALSDGYECPAANDSEAALAWKSIGVKKVKVKLEDSNGNTAFDSVTIRVLSDPPTLRIQAESDTVRQKINAKLSFSVSASDKFGTVQAIDWGCGVNAAKITFDSSAVISSAKTVSAKINVALPSDETNAYKCIARATDDDGEYGYDTIYFRAVLDKPSITLFTTTAEVKINSKVRFAGSAVDTLGKITDYAMACGTNIKNPNWIPLSKPDTTITMPGTAGTWYCAMRVTDDDGLTAMDTAIYKVILDPPTVSVSEDTLTLSIKDTVELDAIAKDALGKIVLYQWSCGERGGEISQIFSSTSTPRFSAIMPTKPTNGYQCIIQVTDDDGQTASDTTRITVLLDPPTIRVSKKSITTRPGFAIEVGAEAYDRFGSIVKREWSCGVPSSIQANWKTVSDFDTTWTGPSTAVASYYCVARATDDDGNQASDTIRVSFTTTLPIITVENDLVYILPGTSTDLTAKVNNVWQGIKRYTWTCGAKGSSALSDTASKNDSHVWWGVDDNYATSDFYFWDDNNADGKPDSTVVKLSKSNSEFFCIVWAEEKGTRFIASDTMTIRTLQSLPVGVINMPDTAYLWSLDSSVLANESKYWYTPDANGSSSILGTLGDRDAQRFWWNFSNVSDTYWYEGKQDGSLDTNILEFNTAFIRRSSEGYITVQLDYYDSSKTGMDQNFVSRHEAQIVSKKVYFRKAWNNISGGKSDSIVETTTDGNGPALAYCNDKLILAYVGADGKVKTRYRNGSSWTSFGNPSIENVKEQTLFMDCDNNGNLYLSYIKSTDDKGYVFKSENASGTWTALGSGLGNTLTSFRLKVNPKTNQPSVAWVGKVGGTAGKARIQDYNGTSWGTAFSPIYSTDWQNRELDMAFDDKGNRLIISSGYATNDYNIYYYYLPSGATKTSSTTNNKIAINGESIQAIYAKGYFYVGFRDRDNDGQPRISRASASENSLNRSGAFEVDGAEFRAFGHRSFNVFLAVDKDGYPIVAIDDAYYARNSHVHVYRFKESWKELGENELPYFKNVFAATYGYYVRGFRPQIAVSSDGRIYISMRAQESAASAAHAASLPGTKNGPLVMEFRGDDW